jgi:hypothetical protein
MSTDTSVATEVSALSANEVDQVSGAAAQLIGGILIGIATNAIYDWLKAPSSKTIPEFFSYLND